MNKEEFKKFVISEVLKLEEGNRNSESELSEEDKPKAIKKKAKVPKPPKVEKTVEEKKSKKDKVKETKKKLKPPKVAKTKKVDEGVTPQGISQLTEEIKKINKKLDFRNPLISEDSNSIVNSILSESESKRMKTLYDYKTITDEDVG